MWLHNSSVERSGGTGGGGWGCSGGEFTGQQEGQGRANKFVSQPHNICLRSNSFHPTFSTEGSDVLRTKRTYFKERTTVHLYV